MITLDDAIERAQVMSGDDNLLSQYAYDVLVSELSEEDVYPFTMALTERGVLVKTSRAGNDSDAFDEVEELVRSAQRYDTQSDSGIWTPSSWDDGDEGYWELDESDLEEYDPDEVVRPDEFSQPEVDQYDEQILELQQVLEGQGIRLTPEGKVEMYKSSVPGLYDQKLPQGAMPLEIAVKFYDQMLDAAELEQTKVTLLLDLLTRVNTQAANIEMSLEELNNSGYSAASPNAQVRELADGLAEVSLRIEEGDWQAVQRISDDIRDEVDQYSGGRDDNYYKQVEVIDALDRLLVMQEANPDGYQQVVEGLGAMPYAARRKVSGVFDELESWQDKGFDAGAYAIDLSVSVNLNLNINAYIAYNNTRVDSPVSEDQLRSLDWAEVLAEPFILSSEFSAYPIPHRDDGTIEAQLYFIPVDRPSSGSDMIDLHPDALEIRSDTAKDQEILLMGKQRDVDDWDEKYVAVEFDNEDALVLEEMLSLYDDAVLEPLLNERIYSYAENV